MDYEARPYGVYVRPDADMRIMAINSDTFIIDLTGWVQIDEGYEVRYRHAQGNYLPLPVYDERGICRYKLADGKPVERTKAEMDADYAALPEPPMSDAERIAALEEKLKAAEILLGLEA